MGPLVETSWLQDHLEDDGLRILDCHVVFERDSGGELTVESGWDLWTGGHIPGSAHVDLIEELSDPDSEHRFMMPSADQVAEVMARLGVGSGTKTVLYDRDRNMWAARVWWMLRAVGFDDAAVLNGGWRKWTSEDRPVSTAPAPEHPLGEFVPRPRPDVFVRKDQVLRAIPDARVALVNALGPSEHRGETANYGRRGHIPTAINVPAAALVDPETHAYLDADSLRRAMAPVLESSAESVITYCGGGVSATSDALAFRLFGLDDISIYDASMSEWAADPTLPLTIDAH